MKQRIHTTMLLAASGGLVGTPAASAAVTFVGSLQDNASSQISSWSSTAVAKTFDINGNNYYGSDGYAWMNTNDADGSPKAVLLSAAQSTPAYFTAGIAYTGAGAGVSGSYVGAADRLLADGTGSANAGYAGPNHNNTTGATVLQQMFAYTMNRDMVGGETIRVGVVLDSWADTVIGADSLRLFAGSSFADATLVANKRNANMDMYFFDVTGLTSGEQIQLWGAKTIDRSQYGFNAITISGVTFDSVPEPSASLALGLGALMMGFHRRRSRQ